jgi:hypothetical protein
MVTNISVVGLDDVHRAQLETLPGAERYALNPLFTHSEIKQQESFPVARLLEQGTHILRSFPESVDAVIGYWDFPVSTTLPILRRRLGLPGHPWNRCSSASTSPADPVPLPNTPLLSAQ